MPRTDTDTRPAPGAATVPEHDFAADLEGAYEALRAILEGDVPAGVVPVTLAGLETAVVVVEASGGLVPVFAYVNGNLAPVLRDTHGAVPAPLPGGPPRVAS